MTHIIRRFLITSIFFVWSIVNCQLLIVPALAGSGLVSAVGGVGFTQGTKHFWVSSGTPTISGVTTAGAKVSGTVGSQAVSATADGSGNWSWTPTALTGDNQVSITSGSTTTTFTLTIGALPANIASVGGSTLAPAGSVTPTLIFLAGGSAFILLGVWGVSRSFKS